MRTRQARQRAIVCSRRLGPADSSRARLNDFGRLESDGFGVSSIDSVGDVVIEVSGRIRTCSIARKRDAVSICKSEAVVLAPQVDPRRDVHCGSTIDAVLVGVKGRVDQITVVHSDVDAVPLAAVEVGGDGNQREGSCGIAVALDLETTIDVGSVGDEQVESGAVIACLGAVVDAMHGAISRQGLCLEVQLHRVGLVGQVGLGIAQVRRVGRTRTRVAVGVGVEPAVASGVGLSIGDGLIIGTVIREVGSVATGPSLLDGAASGVGDGAESVVLSGRIGCARRGVGRDVSRAGDGRILVVLDGHIKGAGGRIAVDVRSGVGHRGGALGESISGAVGARERTYCTVVGCRRFRPADGGRTGTGIGVLGNVGRHATDGRILIVGDRDVEAARGGVACAIRGGVGHGGRTDRECVPGTVGAGHRRSAAIVGTGRGRPGDGCGADSGIGRLGDVGRHVGEGRILIIGDGDRKACRIGVASGVRGDVGHRGGADVEPRSGGVGTTNGGACTVVCSRGLGPGHGRVTAVGIGRLGDVGRQVLNRGVLIVGHGDREGCRGIVAVDIRSSIRYGGGSNAEGRARGHVGCECIDGAVVGCRRLGPADSGRAIRKIGALRDVGWHARNGGILIVCNDDVK